LNAMKRCPSISKLVLVFVLLVIFEIGKIEQ